MELQRPVAIVQRGEFKNQAGKVRGDSFTGPLGTSSGLGKVRGDSFTGPTQTFRPGFKGEVLDFLGCKSGSCISWGWCLGLLPLDLLTACGRMQDHEGIRPSLGVIKPGRSTG